MPASVTSTTRCARRERRQQLGGAALPRCPRSTTPPGRSSVDPEVGRQPAQPAGVLGRDDVGAGQLGGQPRRRVVGPPDRRRREHQGHAVNLRPPRWADLRDLRCDGDSCGSRPTHCARWVPRRTAVRCPGCAPGSHCRRADSSRRAGWLWPLAVTAVALGLRLWHLGQPDQITFDETYYAKDAWSLIRVRLRPRVRREGRRPDQRRQARPQACGRTPRPRSCTPRSASG